MKSQQPMSEDEVIARIKELNGPDERTALIVSIEKWERLGQCEFNKVDNTRIVSGTCGLCRFHHRARRKYYDDAVCGKCPLKDDNDAGCETGSQWRVANRSIGHNQAEFIQARNNILRRMKRALKRLDERTH